MLTESKSRAERYLHRLRYVEEVTALRRVRATQADLRVWRRDTAFREEERAARAAPPTKSRVIPLNQTLAAASSAEARGVGYLRVLERARRVGDAALEAAVLEEIAQQTGKRLKPELRSNAADPAWMINDEIAALKRRIAAGQGSPDDLLLFGELGRVAK